MDLDLLQECEEAAEDLLRLQAGENQGRGIPCVRTLCVYVRRGDLGRAQQLCRKENTRLRNYPRVRGFIGLTLNDLFLREGLEPVATDYRGTTEEEY